MNKAEAIHAMINGKKVTRNGSGNIFYYYNGMFRLQDAGEFDINRLPDDNDYQYYEEPIYYWNYIQRFIDGSGSYVSTSASMMTERMARRLYDSEEDGCTLIGIVEGLSEEQIREIKGS